MKVQDRIALFIKKEGFKPEAYYLCPQFEKCSVNFCPLDSNNKLRTYSEFDKERKCKMNKSIRKEIGIYFNLPNKGLTNREISGQKRWDALRPEEKQAKQEKLKKISLFNRLSEKGYKIARVSKDNSNLLTQNAPKPSIKALQKPVLKQITPKNEVFIILDKKQDNSHKSNFNQLNLTDSQIEKEKGDF